MKSDRQSSSRDKDNVAVKKTVIFIFIIIIVINFIKIGHKGPLNNTIQ